MKYIYKGFYFFIAAALVLTVFDYSKNTTINWVENIASALIFVVFYMVFSWLFDIFKNKLTKEKG